MMFLLGGSAPTEERDLRPALSSKRIDINGGNADLHEWPWQVSLTKSTWYGRQHFCGGSIIHNKWVLTAAHCVKDQTLASFQIVVGAHNRDQKTQHQEVHYPEQIFIHQSYHGSHLRADVALIRLTKKISLHDHVLAVSLPRQGDRVSPGTKCFLTGWGQTNGDNRNSAAKVLQEADLTIASHQKCVDLNGNFIDYGSMICAGGQGKGACFGDSGGPLVCHEGKGWILRGVASFVMGYSCSVYHYTGFARVSSFVDWIENKMNN